MAVNYGITVPGITEGLAFYLDANNIRSYPKSGTSWFDIGPRGLLGTMTNVSFSGNDMTFNGTSSQVEMNYTQTNVLKYSVEVWAKTSATGGMAFVQNRGISGQGTGKSLTMGLLSPGGGPSGTTGAMLFTLDSDGIGQGLYSNTTYNDGNWHQFVGVLDIPNGVSLTTAYLKMYVDGIQITSVNGWGVSTSVSPFTGLGNLRIGYHELWNHRLNGSLNVVKIYDNKALTADEVTKNFNALRGRFGI